MNDRVPLYQAENMRTSLRFMQVDSLTLSVLAPGAAFGDPKRKVYGWFEHNGDDYRLTVTDPVYERAYLAKGNGTYELGTCYLTVSLGEPWEGFCYKLIAAIIERDGGIRT